MARSSRKRKVFEICLNLEDRYACDMMGFVRDHMDFGGLMLDGPTDQQVEMGDEWMRWRRVCVAGGGGIGKTAEAAWGVIWGILCHCNSKVLVTGPTGNQLSDVLWSEVHFWVKRCRFGRLLDVKSRWLTVRGFPEWRAVLRVTKDDADQEINDTMAGMHARWMGAIVDEGSRVSDPVYTAIEGAMTQEDSYVFVISNPVSRGGYYYDTITAKPDDNGLRNGYRVLFYSSLGSPLVSADYESTIIRRYGRDSSMYRAKVLGQALEGGEDRVVVAPVEYDRVVSENRGIMDGPLVISIDPSAGGMDKALVLFRRGLSCVEWHEKSGKVDAEDLVDDVIRLWRARYVTDYCVCIVDAIGSDVYSILNRKRLFQVIPHMGSAKPYRQDLYLNRRTEVYDELSKRFGELHFPVRPPERLKKELANLIIRKHDDNDLLCMEPKKKFRKRMGFSPDYADVLSMSVSVDAYSVVRGDAFMNKGVERVMAGLGDDSDDEWSGRRGRQSVMDMMLSVGGPRQRYGEYGRFF